MTSSTDPPRRSLLPPVVIVALSLVVAVLAGVAAERYSGLEGHSVFILAIVAALLAFELGETYHKFLFSEEIRLLQEAQEKVVEGQASLQNSLEIIILNNKTAQTFQAVSSGDWHGDFAHIAKRVPEVDSCWTASSCERDLLQWKRAELLSMVRRDVDSLADGDMFIDQSEKELLTNSDFLRDLAQNQLRAVSYQDEEFWKSDSGRTFLLDHKTRIEAGVSIERIFIIDQSKQSTISALIEDQKRVGVKVRVAYIHEIARNTECIQDFVLYDRGYVRHAALRHFSTMDKVATLSKRQAVLTRFENHYQVLLRVSHAA